MCLCIRKNERQKCLVVQHRLCIENRISSCKKETGSPLARLRSKSYTLRVIHLVVCAWSAVPIAYLAAIRSFQREVVPEYRLVMGRREQVKWPISSNLLLVYGVPLL